MSLRTWKPNEPHGPVKLLGWRRWRDKYGNWTKYHAFLSNHRRNHIDENADILVSDACRVGWAYLTDKWESLPFEQDPPKDKRCKNCLRDLAKLGLI